MYNVSYRGGGICVRESEKGTTPKNYFYLNFKSAF